MDNIQLILVNNGSTDSTDEICRKYNQLYPENIVYIKNEKAIDVDLIEDEVDDYIKGEYSIVLYEPYKLNRDVLSSLVVKINNDLGDDLFVTIQRFDDFEETRFTYNFRDLDSFVRKD